MLQLSRRQVLRFGSNALLSTAIAPVLLTGRDALAWAPRSVAGAFSGVAGFPPDPSWSGDGSREWSEAMGSTNGMEQALQLQFVLSQTPEAQILELGRLLQREMIRDQDSQTVEDLHEAIDREFRQMRERYSLPRNGGFSVLPEIRIPERATTIYMHKQQNRSRSRSNRNIAALTEAWRDYDMPWKAIGVWALRNLNDLRTSFEVNAVIGAFNRKAPSRYRMRLHEKAGRFYLFIEIRRRD